jgi:hypothetical protein
MLLFGAVYLTRTGSGAVSSAGMLLLGWLMVALGVLLLGLRKCTRIVLDGRGLEVTHVGLVRSRSRRIDAATIDRFYCTRHLEGETPTYSLEVRSTAGETMELVDGLGAPYDAIVLQRMLAEQLGRARLSHDKPASSPW